MNNRPFILGILALLALGIYLFVSAPPPLPENQARKANIPIHQVLTTLNEQNSRVRKLYTQEIVAKGKKAGLKFSEHWEDDTSRAGPLPAQFLRLTSLHLEKNPLPLGLYLGSDYPINQANRFSSQEDVRFQMLKQSREPQFFFVEDIQRFAFMFADVAIADACTHCHNQHEQSPKDDWKRGDTMGATTWTFPDEYIDYQVAVELFSSLRSSFKNAYATFIDKIQTEQDPPEIGDRWPAQGYFLPSVETFMQRVDQLISSYTMQQLYAFDKNKIANK